MLKPEPVAAGVWRFPLPSKTLPPFDHTNSYLIKRGDEAVLIDAGSGDTAVLDALATSLAELGVTRLKALLLTHTHPDHCAGTAALQERYGAAVYVHGLEQPRLDFPTKKLADGDTVTVGGESLSVHHTPGHSPGHLSFTLPDTLTNTLTVFVGDLLAAQGSTWVGLPEGNVSDYLASLARLQSLIQRSGSTVFGPGHGPLVRNPEERLGEVRAHRLSREADLVRLLEQPRTLAELKAHFYSHAPATLGKLVEGTLQAHLGKLMAEGRAVSKGETFRAVPDTKRR